MTLEGFIPILIIAITIITVLYFSERTEFENQIENLRKNTEKNIKELDNLNLKIENLSKENSILTTALKEQQENFALFQKDYFELKKKLEIFTEINADSKKLNVFENKEEIDEIINEILTTTEDSFNKSEKNINSNNILDAEQNEAFNLMKQTKDNLFITGKAGTGKSFILNLFVKGTEKNILKVAPTGIAALNIEGSTMHTTFGYKNLEELSIDDISANTIKLTEEKKNLLQHVDTIIFDEVSMLRADVFDKIEHILQVVNKNNELFGGKQIILFGDPFQLPPIANNEEQKFLMNRYGGIFFFNSNAYKNGNFKFIELKTNHRQKDDNEFFAILNRIREGSVLHQDILKINKQYTRDSDALRRVVRIFPKKEKVETVNRNELNKIPAKEYTYTAQILYNKNKLNPDNIEKYFPCKKQLVLKLGALIMMIKNDVNGRWVNGTLAIVSQISENFIKVKIDGIEYAVEKDVFVQQEAIYKDNKIQYQKILEVLQYPVILAYAITIHKSQGMTYHKIACDLTDCFAAGQAYVALSRCSSLNGINMLSEISEREIKVDSMVQEFYKTNTYS